MSESLIKSTFVILGTLLASIILFLMIFGVTGQQMMWRAIKPVMEDQWSQSTLDNGGKRTIMFEEQFDKMETVKYNVEQYS